MSSPQVDQWAEKRAERARLLSIIEAFKAAESRLFKGILEQVGPLAQWPLHTLSQMLSTHLTYQPRINLTLFVLGNHCAPDLYAEWCMSRNMLKNKAAHLHVANLIKEHKAGQLARFNTYILPFRVSAPPKPLNERKHPWDGVGDPMPSDAPPSAFIFPVETPKMMDTDGWRWDHAFAELTTSYHLYHLPSSSRSVPEVKIVEEQDEVRTDMYGFDLLNA